MPISTLERLYTLTLIAALAWALLALFAGDSSPQAVCTHWASPQGSGSTCSEHSPCKVASWWSLAGPGKTLCLLDGVYAGAAALIAPPQPLSGTQTAPITIKAANDGKVLLDAQHSTSAVSLMPGNNWWVIEGLNATNGLESLYRLRGSHILGKRLIGWNGTSGQDDSLIFNLGREVDVVVEDCAAWGYNSRKVVEGSQSQAEGAKAGWSGMRRCWAEWNDHPLGPDSQPSNTYQIGYRTRQQRFENVLGTWNSVGDVRGAEAIVTQFYDCEQASASLSGTQVLGSLFYLPNGNSYPTGELLYSFCTADAAWKDVAVVVGSDYPWVKPGWFPRFDSAAPQVNNVCDNCLAVHAGSPWHSDNGNGWTFPGLKQGNGLAAATGGQSAFTLLPGLCRRYVRGQLTNEPLWPWPMNQRIKDARAASGSPAVDVTQTIETLLGPLPASCRSGGGGGPTDSTPPTVTITAPSQGALVSGTAVAVTAEASDNVGVVGIQFYANGEAKREEQTGAQASAIVDTTTVANGPYRLTAHARDAAGNTTASAPIDVTVFNSPQPEPPAAAHPPLACRGHLGAQGVIELACTPQGGLR